MPVLIGPLCLTNSYEWVCKERLHRKNTSGAAEAGSKTFNSVILQTTICLVNECL